MTSASAPPSRRQKSSERLAAARADTTERANADLDDGRPPTVAAALAGRRVPLLGWAVVGAIGAGVYASLGLGMRFGPPLVMTALGGLTLILCAGALWRVIDPLTRAEVRAPEDARAPHRVRELEREKQAVLKAIKEIELDYQMRKISEPDYREMIERYRARALRVLGDLAAGNDYRVLIERELKGRLAAMNQAMNQEGTGESPPAAASLAASPVTARVTEAVNPTRVVPPAPSVPSAGVPAPTAAAPAERVPCPGCQTPNEPDAQFCKRCGTHLMPAPPSSVPA